MTVSYHPLVILRSRNVVTPEGIRPASIHIRDGLIDNSVSRLAKPDGSADVGAVLKFLVRRPWRIPRLAKLGKDMNTAASAAANALVRAIGPQ